MNLNSIRIELLNINLCQLPNLRFLSPLLFDYMSKLTCQKVLLSCVTILRIPVHGLSELSSYPS